MTRSRTLEPGTLLVLHGVTYKVLIQHEPDSIEVRNLQTQQESVLQCSDVWKSWKDGDVQFVLPGEKLDKVCEFHLDASSPVGQFSEDNTSPHATRAQSQSPIPQSRWDEPLTYPNQRAEVQFATLGLLIVDKEHPMEQEQQSNCIAMDTSMVDLLIVPEDRHLPERASLLVTRDRFTGLVVAFAFGKHVDDEVDQPNPSSTDS
jgi:hypothetical protein